MRTHTISKSEFRKFNLQGYVLGVGKPCQWLNYYEEDGTVGLLKGLAFIDRRHDVVWLDWYFYRGGSKGFANMAEHRAALAELPLWIGTRWAAKVDGLSGDVCLFDCRTGKPLEEENPDERTFLNKLRRYAAITSVRCRALNERGHDRFVDQRKTRILTCADCGLELNLDKWIHEQTKANGATTA